MYQKGDIVLIPFPFTDLSGSKVRPAVVIASHKRSTDIIVVFITSKLHTEAQFSVPIKPSLSNGIKVASTIVCDKIATLDTKVVVGKIGVCARVDVEHIDTKLRSVLAV